MNRPDVPPGTSELEQAFFRDGYLLASDYLSDDHQTGAFFNAVRHLYAVLEEFLAAFLNKAEKDRNPGACKKGCAWCCHQAVFAQSYEYRYLKEWMFHHLAAGELEQVRKKAKHKLNVTGKLTQKERLLHKESCPLLKNDVCMAYDARPVACRIYLSKNVESCKHEFRNPADTSRFPDLYELPFRAGRKLNEGFSAGLSEAGIDTTEYPMEKGLLL